MTTTSSNIVVEWLRSLHLGQYAESFLDNGYDDLEICKQVGDPDLDAIGVFNPNHRLRLLHSVRTLREEGAASVYFTLEESAAVHDECMCDSSSSRTESSTGKHGSSDKDISDKGDDRTVRVNSRNSSRSNESSKDVPGKVRDEYEEGKAELVKIPRSQLKGLLKDKLNKDGIRLSCQPYSTSSGDKGYLEGLASRYADLFNTHYCDVLEHLEEIRRKEWNELSPRICVLQSETESPGTPPGTFSPTRQVTTVSLHGLTTSLSQPIYVPGKYSPSSCLSDKEEDEIYGFAGYGIYGKQMHQRQQQQRKLFAQNQTGHAQGYQACLSPRSAYFYEFPPTDQTNTQSSKKKTTFSKFLRGLRTVHRKEKHGSSSPRHGRDSRLQGGFLNERVGNSENSPNRSPMLPLPPMDPRKLNYDHLRVLQLNGSASNFEETIYRLKIQDALKKKERFHREHEEILRDIREGLSQLRRNSDDTYMYDEDVRALAPHHWYDEPPYESDPEDFLMGLRNGQQATSLQNARVCFTLNPRADRQREGIMSHPSAGDISIPRENDSTPQRGLILPQYGPYPPTIIPLTHARSNRESGDYAGTDVQSISSRLSTFSMETTRSEQQEYYQFGSGRGKVSSDQSSDYEDHDLPLPIERLKFEGNSAGKSKYKKTKEKELSRIKGNLHSASSGESLPSGSGSSTQALMRETSGHSSLSAGDDRENSSPIGPAPQGGTIAVGPVIARARALVDCSPSHYDREALKFKKGDIIDVLQMNPSGLWQGITHGKAGLFKFINVELLSDKTLKRLKQFKQHKRGKPKTVEELLKRISMEEYTSVFVLNGYEDVELFQDLESQDLDYLNIRDPEHRAKILTAVQLLHDYDSNDEKDEMSSCSREGDGSCSSEDESSTKAPSRSTKQGTFTKNLRDSGCFEEDTQSGQRKLKAAATKSTNTSNNLDSVGGNLFFSAEGRKPQQKNSTTSKHHQSPGRDDSGENLEMDVFANLTKTNYQPNIPVSDQKKSSAKDFLEQTREVLNRAREIANNSREILERSSGLEPSDSSIGECRQGEDSCETNAKLTMVKYVAGGYNDLGVSCETGNAGFSEKSSDSGVSSSSMSSANFKDKKLNTALTAPVDCSNVQRLESPKKGVKSLGKHFTGLSEANKRSETLNPFLKNSKCRPLDNLRSGDRSESKGQEISSPNGFPNQFHNRSLIVQKKT